MRISSISLDVLALLAIGWSWAVLLLPVGRWIGYKMDCRKHGKKQADEIWRRMRISPMYLNRNQYGYKDPTAELAIAHIIADQKKEETKETMRDYQRQKNNKFILPRAVYHKTLWQIRDYYRLKEEAEGILHESSQSSNGMPRGTAIGDPVYSKAVRREESLRIINAIEEAKATIPKEYQKGIWDSIQYGSRYPMNADRTTYGRWKSFFVYHVAEKLGY